MPNKLSCLPVTPDFLSCKTFASCCSGSSFDA